MESFDAVIVGAGWAGISVSYALKQAGIDHIVLEKMRICETWRTQRWDSFRMNTPNVLTVLPGDSYDGPDPQGYMTRDDFVDMVGSHAERNDLPVREHVAVESVRPANGGFEVRSVSATLFAKRVVVATGNLNRPKWPSLAKTLPPRIHQIDGTDYRNAAALPPGAILVIGCGNTGGQIAEEIAREGRTVFLSSGRNGRVPRTYRGRDIFLWLTDTGRMAKSRTTSSGRGLIGATHTISLQSLSADGITLLGRLMGCSPDGRLTFDDTLADSAACGDQMADMLRQEIDDYIDREAIDAPEAVPDPAEVVPPRFPDPPIRELDLAARGISTVIWAAGLRGNFDWLDVPGTLDANGLPVQDNCVSVPGIYFAGLDSLKSLRAGTVLAAKEEASRIVGHMVNSQP